MSTASYDDHISGTSNGVKKHQNRSNQMTTKEKKKLAALIRERDLLWNLHPHNKDANSHQQAWKDIAAKMGKPIAICKHSWRALKDGYRYRFKVGERMRKQGEVNDPREYLETNWEFGKDLSFLATARRPNNVYILSENAEVVENSEPNECSTSSFIVKDEISLEADPINTFNDRTKYNVEEMDQDFVINDIEESAEYVYETGEHHKSASKQYFQSNEIINQLGKLVNAQTELIREFKSVGTTNFAFKIQLSALDSLLQQLPKSLAEKTLIEMQNYVLKRINEQPRD